MGFSIQVLSTFYTLSSTKWPANVFCFFAEKKHIMELDFKKILEQCRFVVDRIKLHQGERV
jgi:hypothetical protein